MSVSAEMKAAELAAKVATDMQQQGLPAKPAQQVAETSPFAQILEQHEFQMDAMQGELLQAFGVSDKTHPADKAVSARGLDIDVAEAKQLDPVENKDWTSNILSQLNHEGLQMEKTVEMITMPGRNFSNFELLAIQAQLHAATFKAELFMKIADATKTIPQTMINRYGGQ